MADANAPQRHVADGQKPPPPPAHQDARKPDVVNPCAQLNDATKNACRVHGRLDSRPLVGACNCLCPESARRPHPVFRDHTQTVAERGNNVVVCRPRGLDAVCVPLNLRADIFANGKRKPPPQQFVYIGKLLVRSLCGICGSS